MIIPGPYDRPELGDGGDAGRRGGARRGAGRRARRGRRPDHHRRHGLNGLRDAEDFEARQREERQTRRQELTQSRRHAEEIAELEEIAARGITLISTGLRKGPRVTFLSSLQLVWGDYWTNLEKAFKQKMVKLLISTFSDHYFQLMDADDFLVDLWYAVAAMLQYARNGGDFALGYTGWAPIEHELKENADIDPLQFEPLYEIIADPVLKNDPKFLVTVRNPPFSDFFFRNNISTITETVKNLHPHILQNLECILYPSSEFQHILRMQNPNNLSIHSPFMGYILENIKQCFAHKFLCLECCLSFPSLQKSLSHINGKHKSFIDQDVYVASIDQRTTRAVLREREKGARALTELQLAHDAEIAERNLIIQTQALQLLRQ